MKTLDEVELDAVRVSQWLMDTADEFAPLDIVAVSARPDGNADGNLIIFVTVVLNPPNDGGSWPTADVLRLYKAVHRWGYGTGYVIAPHVHLQSAQAA